MNTNLNNNNTDSATNPEPTTNIKSEFTDYGFTTNEEKRTRILNKGSKLISFTKRNTDPKHLNFSIYHLLLDPFTIDNSYKNLSKNRGSFTAGVKGYTVENYSRKESINITKLLKTKTFIPDPVKRVYVPKPGKSTLRPLGIPTFKDRIVQEAMRGILEAIYEPEFKQFEELTKKCTNFGFRPNKSCWDAIENFTQHAQKSTFVIEGDIKGAFVHVVHKTLLTLISKRIKDKNFMNLLKSFLDAGIMTGNQYEHSLLGVPQGGILSPLLFNIYMFEFDKFIYYEIIKKYDSPTPPTKNKTKEYQALLFKKNRELKEYRALSELLRNNPNLSDKKSDKISLEEKKKKFLETQNKMFQTHSYDRSEEINISYTRYADDWILAVAGNLKLATEIKEKIADWLKSELELELSAEKTKITNIRKDFVKFLGYKIILRSKYRNIKIANVPVKDKTTNKITKYVTRRTTSSKFYVQPNDEKLLNKIKELGIVRPVDYFPMGKRAWAQLNEYQIVQKYHSMFLGLVQHYSRCDSLHPLNRLSYIFLYSCAKTIATRKRITMKAVFAKYGKQLEINSPYLDHETKTRNIKFMGLTEIRKKYLKNASLKPLSPEFDPFKIRTFWRTTYKLYSLCCICGCEDNIQMHHINSIKSIKQSIKNERSFKLILMQLNRKQIPVCHECHTCITNGKYDNMKLSDLYARSLAAL